jgi:hypothetical protein
MNLNKLTHLSLTFASALALGLTGCGKNETPGNTAETTASQAAETAKIEAAKAAAIASAEAAKANAAKADAANAEAARAEAAKVEAAKIEAARVETARVEAAKVEAARVEAANAASLAKAQSLIDQAKSLIADGHLSDASGVLEQLAGQSLSTDQTSQVNGLKQQLQKALVAKAATDASGAAGNILKQ